MVEYPKSHDMSYPEMLYPGMPTEEVNLPGEVEGMANYSCSCPYPWAWNKETMDCSGTVLGGTTQVGPLR